MGKEIYVANALTGGASGALDRIDGADLDGDSRAIVITNGTASFYYIDPTSAAAESSPDVIMPDMNAGDKRWALVNVIGIADSGGSFDVQSSGSNDSHLRIIDAAITGGFDFWMDYSSGHNYVDGLTDSDSQDIRFRTRTVGTPVQVLTLEGAGNVGIGTVIGPTANGGKVLFFGDNAADPTMAADTAGLYGKDVSGTVEMFAIDEAGNKQQLTAHPSNILDKLPALKDRKTSPHGVQVSNSFLGESVYIDLALLAEKVEELTGEKIIHKTTFPKKDWDTEQQIRENAIDAEIKVQKKQKAKREKDIADWEARKEKLGDKLKDEKPRPFNEEPIKKYVKKSPPLWMQKRGVKSNL